MEFFIYCYGDMETLRGLFEGIARITRIASPFGSQFASIIKVIMLLGFLVMLIYGLATPGKFPVISWFAGVMLVYGLLFLPTAKVWFLDNTREGATAAGGSVDDVPFGLALLASLTSHIGHQLTVMFEDGMQSVSLPETLRYSKHGLIPGNRMVTESRKVNIKTPQLYMDMMNFLYNCTMYDIADGTIDANAIQTSTDIWDDIGPSEANPSRYTPVGSDGTLVGCRTAHAQISTALTNEIPIARADLLKKMNPDRTLAEPEAYFDEQFRAAMQTSRLSAASADVTRALRQNMMVNIVAQSSGVIGQKMADSATVMYGSAVSQASAATNMGYLVQGTMAAQAMPMIRNAIEAVAYALFPFVILICFVSSATGMLMALKSYIMTLVWVQLWPPIYAVLNYVATLTCGYNIGSAGGFASDQGGGVTLANANTIYGAGISNEAVVGYMTVLVPVIASALVYGGSKAGSIGVQSMVASSGRASEAAASGNVSMGSVSMNQQNLAASRSDPTLSMAKTQFGEEFSKIDRHQGAVQIGAQERMSSYATSVKLSEKDAEQYHAKSTQYQKLGQTFEKTAAEHLAAANVKMEQFAHTYGKGTNAGAGSAHSTTATEGATHRTTDGTANTSTSGRSGGTTQTDGTTASAGRSASAGVKGSIGPSTPWGGAQAVADAGVQQGTTRQKGTASQAGDAASTGDSGTHGSGSETIASKIDTWQAMSVNMSLTADQRQAAKSVLGSLTASEDASTSAKKAFEEGERNERIAAGIHEASRMSETQLSNALTPYLDQTAYQNADHGTKQAMILQAAEQAVEDNAFGMSGHAHRGPGDPPIPTSGSVINPQGKEQFDASSHPSAPSLGNDAKAGVTAAHGANTAEVHAEQTKHGVHKDLDAAPAKGGGTDKNAAQIERVGGVVSDAAKADKAAVAAAATKAAGEVKAHNEKASQKNDPNMVNIVTNKDGTTPTEAKAEADAEAKKDADRAAAQANYQKQQQEIAAAKGRARAEAAAKREKDKS